IFSCDTTNGKQVMVQNVGEQIEYAFGDDLENPELLLSVPRDDASTWQWKGIGRYMGYSVTLPNGQYTYTAFYSVDRMTEGFPLTSGITVANKNQHIATIYCLSNTLNESLQGIDLKDDE
ncbi:MAG: hypothetical protein ACPHUL_10720, partial [Marinomonas gallaica]